MILSFSADASTKNPIVDWFVMDELSSKGSSARIVQYDGTTIPVLTVE